MVGTYAWVVPLKDKRGITSINAFQKIISKARKPNKLWLDQGGKLYNNLFNRFLKKNNIEMFSTYNEVKSFVAERFIRTLKSKTFKHMTAVSKNAYFDVLDDIVNKNNNTVHSSIKVKPIDVTSDYYAKYNNFNVTKPKFKVDDHIKTLKYKNIFTKGYTQNWSGETKNTVPRTNVIGDLNGEPIITSFYEKELQKRNQKEFRIEKVLKIKDD